MKIMNMGLDKWENPHFVTDRMLPKTDYSLIGFKSPSVVLIDTSYVTVSSGTYVFFDGHARQYYRPCEGMEFLHDFITLRPETPEEKRLAEEIAVMRPFRAGTHDRVAEALRDIDREQKGSERFKWSVLPLLCQIFLYRVRSEQLLQQTDEESRLHYERLGHLREDIYAHPRDNWTVGSMSAAVHLSPSYFQSLYKRFFGESCMNDVIHARMLLAKELLRQTDLKIGDISEECGYRNVEHFIRQFKAQTGVSPRAFRAGQQSG